MSLNAATIEILIAKGLTAADLLDVARATEVKADRTNAERQERHRAKRRNAVIVTAAPLNEDTSKPVPDDKPSGYTSGTQCAKPDPFPCPENVDPLDWEGLKANRKKKRAALSPGAHRAILGKLAKFADAGWPPGPIVAKAAERGWTTVFEPDEMRLPANGNHRPVNSLRGSRPDPALDLMRAGEAVIAAESAGRGDASDRGAWPALSASGASRP